MSNGELLKIVKQDNDSAIKEMEEAIAPDPKCIPFHKPLIKGIARSIRVQEIVLDCIMSNGNGNNISVKNGNGNGNNKFKNILNLGWIKTGGIPAMIIAGFFGLGLMMYLTISAVENRLTARTDSFVKANKIEAIQLAVNTASNALNVANIALARFNKLDANTSKNNENDL